MTIKTDMKGIHKRGNSYTITISSGFDGNGKQIRHYTTFKPPEGISGEKADKLAMRAYEEFYNKCNRVENENGNMFFKDLYTAYFNEYAPSELKKSTIERYKSALDVHCMPVFGNRRLKSITKRDVQSFLCNQPTLKGSSCKGLKMVLSSVFSFAVAEGFIEVNPCVNAKHKKDNYDISKFQYLTKDEVIKLLDITKDYSQFNIIIRMLLLTGMRIGELLALNIEQDIDFKYNLLRINSTLSHGDEGWFVDTTKTKSSTRVIKVNSAIMEMVKQELEHREEKKKLCGDSWVETGLLFTGANGRYVDRPTVSRRFNKFLARNDLPPIHLHSLRHTFATLLIYMGNDTKTVSSALGHSQTQITNDIYVHIYEEQNARISDALCNDLLKSAEN